MYTNLDWNDLDLDYRGENNYASFFASGSMIHTYPAKAVPDMVHSILNKLTNDYQIKTVLDPFVGSGTTALEAKYLNLDFYGSDLNPLAILLSRTKVLQISDVAEIKKELLNIIDGIVSNDGKRPVVLDTFDNIDYWFKTINIKQLSYIKSEIKRFLDIKYANREIFALIMLTAFSETIRESSLSRKNEFKLYRMSKNDIKKYEINSVQLFANKIKELLDMIVHVCPNLNNTSKTKIVLENAKNLSYLDNQTIDLVITSPPYGDSKSTVAYGEFSRLSIQWMQDLLADYLNIYIAQSNCDELLLGGRKSKIKESICGSMYNSPCVMDLISRIDQNINESLLLINDALDVLNSIEKGILNKDVLVLNLLNKNDYLISLLRERLRLNKFREYNNVITDLSLQEKKNIARNYSQQILALCEKPLSIGENDYKIVCDALLQVKEVIRRKLNYIPKRKLEVVGFLKDLYQVVLETDRVLKKGGLQTWIVGHRTVFGDITIDLSGILKDWFENLSYKQIANMERKYSFKRMPHHINSTVSRNEKVNTMMYEYILIMQKE